MRVPSVCAFPKDLESIAAPDAPPRLPRHWTHESRRMLTRLLPPIPELWNCYVHAACVCNELVSATNRILGVVPKPTGFGIRLLRRSADLLGYKLYPIEPMSDDRFLDCYTGPKRTRYVNAIGSLKYDPITSRDAKISAFIKAEKCDPGHKVNPDPRMIQARSARYNYLLGRWLKPLEKVIYGKLKDGLGTRMVFKGLNQRDRGSLLLYKWELFDDPVAIPLDGSRWDKHIAEEVLRVEHSVYRKAIKCPLVDRLLAWQYRNVCKTRNQVSWVSWYRRMSGDVNTGLGNSLLMCLMLQSIFRFLGVRKWCAAVDGDDGVPIIERKDLSRVVEALPRLFLAFGQEVKVEEPTSLQGIKFCQTKLVFVDGVPIMLRDWTRCLAHDTSGVKHWGDPNVCPSLLKAVGQCNLALNMGVPILQEHALACIRNAGDVKVRYDILALEETWARYKTELGTPEASIHAKPGHISDSTRLSFMEAFGVDVATQLDYERRLRLWSITSFQPVERPLELDHTWKETIHPDSYTVQI